MIKKKGMAMTICMMMLLTSCDDGRLYENQVIHPEEGRVVKLTGNILGIDEWTNGYSVVIAGFTNESEYAIISKSVTTDNNGQTEVVLSGINDEVERVELCVTNRLRKRILTFQAIGLHSPDTIRMEVGTINLGVYASIQEQLFNTTCTSCHGASTFAGAGLYLTEEKSYDALVGEPSQLINGMLLVNPGDAGTSVLYQTIATDISSTWRQDHSNMVMSTAMHDIVGTWINNIAND